MSILQRAKNKIKRTYHKITEFKIQPNIQLDLRYMGKEFLDNSNSKSDGTWLYTEIFQKREQPYVIYSFGLGSEIYFEQELLDWLSENGIAAELYGFDCTPKSLEYVNAHNVHKNFHVLPYALCAEDGEVEFALPTNEKWTSGTFVRGYNDDRQLDLKNKIHVQGRSLQSIMNELGHKSIDLLKMDIEGSEFYVMDIFDGHIEISELLIDFHSHMFWDYRKKTKKLYNTIIKNYDIFYSGNEPKTIGALRKNTFKTTKRCDNN